MSKTGQAINFPSGQLRPDNSPLEAEQSPEYISNPQEKKPEDQLSSPPSAPGLKAEKQAELLDQISLVEARIKLLHSDYNYLTLALEHQYEASIPPEEKSFISRFAWNLLRAGMRRSKSSGAKSQKSSPAQLSRENREKINTARQELKDQIIKLLAEQQALIIQLDSTTQTELGKRAEFNQIRDSVSNKISVCLDAEEAPEQATTSLSEPAQPDRIPALSAEHELSQDRIKKLLGIVQVRFNQNKNRHKGIQWSKVQTKLEHPENMEKLWSLNEMERTGGEPDVVGYENGQYIFFDCSTESPTGRRNLDYNQSLDLAKVMKIKLLTREEYLNKLQKLGDFDRNTWSWVETPVDEIADGVALFGSRGDLGAGVFERNAYDHFDVRGFRGSLRV